MLMVSSAYFVQMPLPFLIAEEFASGFFGFLAELLAELLAGLLAGLLDVFYFFFFLI